MSKFFKLIPGYENYLVSENGQVYSIKRRKYLCHSINNNKYLVVYLCKNGKRKKFLVHRLVALAHLNNPENLPQINHKNGVKTDNRVENLEWVSASQNIKHAYDYGLKENTRQNCKKVGKLNAKHLDENLKELFDDIFINKLSNKNICKKYNLTQAYVSQIKSKQRLQTALKEYEKSNLFQAWDIYFNSSK